MRDGLPYAGPLLDAKWRHPTGNGLTWRLALPEDMPRLYELWGAMDRKLGKQDKPDLLKLPVLLALVAEDEAGVIVGGVYGEAVVDFTGIGTDRRAMESAAELFPELREFFRVRSLRVARVLVPRRLANGMRERLPGFREITQRFAQFCYQIQP